MVVYVDDMKAPFRRMVMSHMMADSSAELMAMADRLGLQRAWLQKAGTYLEHYDVSTSKRAAAVRAGAVQVSRRELVRMMLDKRK